MNKHNVIAVDLAKRVFQICILSKANKVISNKEIRATKFHQFLARQSTSLLAFEACARAHHWARVAQSYGHQVVIIPAQVTANYRQGQKTDHNDALAIAIASKQPLLKTVGVKTLDQQSLQTNLRLMQHVSDQRTATGNSLRGLIAEFGIDIPQGVSALKGHIPMILEDAENGLPLSCRDALYGVWQLWLTLDSTLSDIERTLTHLVTDLPVSRNLLALEGIGPKNAAGLYAELGNGSHFKNGRNAAACIGLTPKQHSSGGLIKLGHIGRHCGNQRLRSALITGAHSMIQALSRRPAKTEKERWIVELVARRGKGRAAVALANKNVRTAWAMLKNNESYQAV